jgi:hypothetical protein
VNRPLPFLALSALSVVATSGCAVTIPTYTMRVADPPQQALQTVQNALAQEGLDCAVVDREKGALATTWRDTGYRVIASSTVEDDYAPESWIFRRYQVLAYPGPRGTEVRLRVDARRCDPPVRSSDVPLGCADASWDTALLNHDLQALARRLAHRTGTTVVSADP